MAQAIAHTITSVVGSSITTIAGIYRPLLYELHLGWDLGIVMAKGVLLGGDLLCYRSSLSHFGIGSSHRKDDATILTRKWTACPASHQTRLGFFWRSFWSLSARRFMGRLQQYKCTMTSANLYLRIWIIWIANTRLRIVLTSVPPT